MYTEPKQILKTPHLLTIIRATEDLETVTPAVYAQASSLFTAAINNFTSSSSDSLTSSQDLAKSVSALSKSTANGWALVASSGSLQSEGGLGGKGQEGVKVTRGWDWRVGAVHMKGRNVAPGDVMRVLRSQVAVEMAKVWM